MQKGCNNTPFALSHQYVLFIKLSIAIFCENKNINNWCFHCFLFNAWDQDHIMTLVPEAGIWGRYPCARYHLLAPKFSYTIYKKNVILPAKDYSLIRFFSTMGISMLAKWKFYILKLGSNEFRLPKSLNPPLRLAITNSVCHQRVQCSDTHIVLQKNKHISIFRR